MQKALVLTLLLLLSSPSWSEEIKNPERVLPKFFEFGGYLPPLQGPQEECPNCYAAAGDDYKPTMEQECLLRICGDEVDEQYRRTSAASDRLIYPEMDPTVAAIHKVFNEAVSAQLDLEREETALALDHLRKGTKFNSPIHVKLKWMEDVAGDINKVVYSEGQVDEKATLRNIANYPPLKQARVLYLGKAIVSSNQLPDFLQGEIAFNLKQLTREELRAKILDVKSQVEVRYKEFTRRFGTDIEAIVDGSGSQKKLFSRLEEELISPGDLQELRSLVIGQKFVETIITAPDTLSGPPASLNVPSLIGKSADKLLTAHIAKLDAFKKSDQTNPKMAEQIRKARSQCVSTAVVSLEFLPTAKQIDDFKAIEARLRKKYLAKISGQLSSESAEALKTHASTWVWKEPLSRDEHVARLRRWLEEARDDDLAKLKRLKHPESLDHAYIVAASQGFKNSLKRDYGERLKKLCTRADFSLIEDRAHMKTEKFEVGVTTAAEPERAESVLFHEYSHLVSGLFEMNLKGLSQISRGWYDKVRECNLKSHPFTDKTTVEEDWADTLSSAFADKPFTRLCTIMRLDDNNALTLKTSKDDTHSSHLYRILRSRVTKDMEIPQSCTQALAKRGQKLPMNKCL